MLLSGRITQLTQFGAFVEVGSETQGLAHVSEIGSGFVANPRDILHNGGEVEMVVKSVDLAQRRISLSIPHLQSVLEEPQEAEERAPTAMELALQAALGRPDRDSKSGGRRGSRKRPSDELLNVFDRMLTECHRSRDSEESQI